MRRPGRRWWIPIAILAALPALVLVLAPLVGARVIRGSVIPKIEERIGRAVRLGGVTVRWGRVDLTDLVVDGAGAPDPVVLPRALVRFQVLPLLGGRVVLDEVVLDHPKVKVVRGESGDDNVSSILDRLRARAEVKGSGGGGSATSAPAVVRVLAGSLSLDDQDLGTVEVRALEAAVRRDGPGHAEMTDVEVKLAAGPSAQAARMSAKFEAKGFKLDGLAAIAVEGGALTVWKGFTLTGVEGGITPDGADRAEVKIDLKGGYGGVDRVLWSAKGTVHPGQRTGAVSLVANRFDLGQLKPILAGTPVIDPELAEIDARIDLRFLGDKDDPRHLHDAVDFDGRFHLSGLSVFHPMLGPNPVRHIGFEAKGKGRLEPRARTLHLEAAEVDYRGVHAAITADVERLGKKPALRANLEIAPVPCQTALLALPAELTPALQGFRLQGLFKTDLHTAIDFSDLNVGVELGGNVGIDGCKVLDAPATVGAARLTGPFEHAAEVAGGEWLTFVAGPDNPDFVPYGDISPHLVNSIMTTEDSTFMRHHGFIPSEFRSALKSNLENGYFRLGASSITMQMVKNVLLSREKTLSRKLQELFLTWYVERSLTKERILEIYFNVIEFGPRIYGIGRAARHYFNKHARDLTPRESAWFSSILPSPKRRYTHYCHGAPDPKWEIYINRILRRMHERGRLSDAEFEHATAAKLAFNREQALPEKECLEMIRKLVTPVVGKQPAARTEEEEEP
ncbi:MAG: hypothetical protein EXR72_22065 [Myxococcales bacterium]|nr:hypothetical protein [Myxococcales bacterium]